MMSHTPLSAEYANRVAHSDRVGRVEGLKHLDQVSHGHIASLLELVGRRQVQDSPEAPRCLTGLAVTMQLVFIGAHAKLKVRNGLKCPAR